MKFVAEPVKHQIGTVEVLFLSLHQTFLSQRLPAARLSAPWSRSHHGGGHRQLQDQDPPRSGQHREASLMRSEGEEQEVTLNFCYLKYVHVVCDRCAPIVLSKPAETNKLDVFYHYANWIEMSCVWCTCRSA